MHRYVYFSLYFIPQCFMIFKQKKCQKERQRWEGDNSNNESSSPLLALLALIIETDKKDDYILKYMK